MAANQGMSGFSPWVRLFFLFFIGGLAVAGFAYFSSDKSFDVVGDQLQDLRNHRVSKAYYEHMSKEFQQTTSLPQFREFLSIYPVLYENLSYRLETSTVEDSRAHLTGILVSKGMEEMKVDWGLVKEDGKWKVAGLRLTELKQDDEADKMIDFAKEQLQALRERDFVEAYYGFVSKDFQQQISIGEFEAFVKENPILFNYRMIDSENSRVEDDRGYVSLHLENGKQTYLLNYTLSRESDGWKIYSLKVILPPEVAIQKAETNPEALVPPIRELLEALEEHQISRAYQLTSKEFQGSTSFENFKKFIRSFPAFSVREMADIKKREVQNGTGWVRVNLHDEEGITAVDFRMGYEEGEWLIWGMEVVDSPVKEKQESRNATVPPLADQLVSLLRQQRTYLHYEDINEAYEQIMSKEYRVHNSVEDFQAFFAANPAFIEHRSSYFNRLLDQNSRAVLRGFITTKGAETLPVRFDFVKEDGKWKIDRQQLLKEPEPIAEAEEVFDKPEEDSPPKPLEFAKIVLGTEVNQQGIVTTPLDEVEGDEDFLFFNVYIDNGQPETVVTLFLEHVDSGTSARPLSTKLDRKGKSTISFSYSSPKGGWPSGDYIAKLTASSGQEYLFKFKVLK
ncbi:putative uncharacterized protein [Waddlia chondrophila 2032/99]|uniref:DUF4878 domain-containing protein n=1 Tax=Waddlia chondrophila 2032/99 TaxID=765953 RepID=F8LAG7_9BACT|nr:putative uncharacterized protein [Waddlia chondrophila 2032/99]